MNKKNGFTLVELLAVIAILGLILIIAVSSVLDSTARAKKENFYLYAQNLNSKATAKYNDDIKENPENLNCVVYDIESDLDISDTGDYEGWVKVLRTPVNSGRRSVVVELNSPVFIANASYCIDKGVRCTPNTSLAVRDDDTSIKVNKTIKEGEVMCATYQYPSNGVLVNGETICKIYNEGVAITDTYKYDIEITLTDKTYVIQDYLINDPEKGNRESLYETIENNKSNPPSEDKGNPTKISSPRCSKEDPITFKGIKNTKTTIITNAPSSTNKTTTTTTTTTIPTSQIIDNDKTEPVPTDPDEPWDPSSGIPDPTLEESNAYLQTLMVSGYVFEFNPKVYNYTLEIKDEDRLNVSYRTQVQNAVAVVSGNENIKDGSKIEVYVQSQNGYYKRTYTIELIRNVPKSSLNKILRIIAISLGVLLVIILIISSISNKNGGVLIRKKVVGNNEETSDSSNNI